MADRPPLEQESNLARVLASGAFAVTAELSPPRSASLDGAEREIDIPRDHVHAANVTDNQGANVRMSSLAPQLYPGAANPFAPPYEYRPMRPAKKVAAGARFAQAQIIYNLPRFREYMARVRDLELLDSVHILAGVAPVKSVGAAPL